MECREMYFPEVVQSVPGEGRTVYAYFSDGSIHRFDVMPLIEQGGVFSKLRDEAFFRERITVLNGTVAWDVAGNYDPYHCIDLDPCEIYQEETVSDPLEEAI